MVLFPDPVPFSVVWMESGVVDLGKNGELVDELDDVEVDEPELDEVELDEVELDEVGLDEVELLLAAVVTVDVDDADDLVDCDVDVGGLVDAKVDVGGVVCEGKVKFKF